VEAFRKKERQDETQFTTKIDGVDAVWDCLLIAIACIESFVNLGLPQSLNLSLLCDARLIHCLIFNVTIFIFVPSFLLDKDGFDMSHGHTRK
jgi:hypothetical protein